MKPHVTSAARTLARRGLLTAIFAVLFALTLVLPDWLEAFTGLDPDRDSGWVETAITLGFGLCAAGSAAATYLQWRRVRPAAN
ncbi:MAG: hypothetical protein QOG34_2033 [Frankiaceae bacterium]|jgi:hypothetical protein|nr:hypothetical protein [Frankiaceae bacterium]